MFLPYEAPLLKRLFWHFLDLFPESAIWRLLQMFELIVLIARRLSLSVPWLGRWLHAALARLNGILELADSVICSPRQMYRRVWREVARRAYDPSKLPDWREWENRDDEIANREDAVREAKLLVAALKDRFTRLTDKSDYDADNKERKGNLCEAGINWDIKTEEVSVGADVIDPLAPKSAAVSGSVRRLYFVSSVKRNSPAERAGIKPGDQIICANGQCASTLKRKAARAMLFGEAGQKVELKLRRGETSFQVAFEIERFTFQNVVWAELSDGIGYVRLESFDPPELVSEMRQALENLQDCRTLIFDLRHNFGGRTYSAVALCGLFMEEGVIGVNYERVEGAPERDIYRWSLTEQFLVTELTDCEAIEGEMPDCAVDSWFWRWIDRKLPRKLKCRKRQPNLSGNKPMVLLTDNKTCSSSELVAAALRDNNRVILVGEKTSGKAIGQTTDEMPLSTMLKITFDKNFTPNGNWLGDGQSPERNGMSPDVHVESEGYFNFGDENDKQLKAAVEVIKQKLG